MPAPVRRQIEVKASQARAFEVFTQRVTSWWPRSHHIGQRELHEVVIEPQVKGRWYEKGVDGSECDWGHVIAWDPPQGLTLAWQLNQKWQFDPNLVTEVEVKFIALGPKLTRVELEHRNLERFGEAAQEIRSKIGAEGGWMAILGSFAAVADLAEAE
jgi:hypothetical protein